MTEDLKLVGVREKGSEDGVSCRQMMPEEQPIENEVELQCGLRTVEHRMSPPAADQMVLDPGSVHSKTTGRQIAARDWDDSFPHLTQNQEKKIEART